MNNIAESAINLFDKLLVTSLQMTIENDVIKYQKDFDASTIYRKIMKCVEHECNYSPGTPNKDAEDYIDIVAYESIFTQLIKYQKEHPNALETLGVKFIKGFINGNAIDEDNMKSLISAAQTKHERIGVLFSEYLNDATTPHGTGAIKTHKETIWDLFNHLLDTLNVADNRALECNLWKIKTLCIESYWSATTF
ncbi:3803_t:CDS:2 [Entrophospora sp. SA101]|nr:3803_t:CDS:2 [Entrophospora sp. SA101]